MAESKEARNKALVLKAFDTLFNKRDYVAAERYWLPNYIQHSACSIALLRKCSGETNERVVSGRVGCARRVGSLE
jgi:hypothetical protein